MTYEELKKQLLALPVQDFNELFIAYTASQQQQINNYGSKLITADKNYDKMVEIKGLKIDDLEQTLVNVTAELDEYKENEDRDYVHVRTQTIEEFAADIPEHVPTPIKLTGFDRGNNSTMAEIAENAQSNILPVVAIIIGHAAGKEGAWSPHLGLSEWEFNNAVATELLQQFHSASQFLRTCEYKIYTRSVGEGQNTIHAQIMQDHVDGVPVIACIELHFNAFHKQTAHGSETLIANDALNIENMSRQLTFAKTLQRVTTQRLSLQDRGVKQLRPQDRGFYNVSNLHLRHELQIPYVIWEPFFGTSPTDCGSINPTILSQTLLTACEAFVAPREIS